MQTLNITSTALNKHCTDCIACIRDEIAMLFLCSTPCGDRQSMLAARTCSTLPHVPSLFEQLQQNTMEDQ